MERKVGHSPRGGQGHTGKGQWHQGSGLSEMDGGEGFPGGERLTDVFVS